MLPAVAKEKLAESVDIFVEHIAFSVEDLQRLCMQATKAGLKTRAHTDQLSNIGATSAAAVLGALSCDHLEYTGEEDITAMRKAGHRGGSAAGSVLFPEGNPQAAGGTLAPPSSAHGGGHGPESRYLADSRACLRPCT